MSRTGAPRPLRAGVPGPLRTAFGLFTVLPAGAPGTLGGGEAARAMLWLPVTGLVLALPAAGVLLAAEAAGHSATRKLLAAVLAVACLAVLTGGLHLDGLADTADGLASRRPRAEALAIMRRPDTGPLGVAALLLVMLGQIAGLAALPPGWPTAGALLAAVVTGRAGAVLATGPGSPAARPEGLGALVAGATGTPARAALAGGLVILAAGGAATAGGWAAGARAAGAVLAGLLAADALRRVARRRLGGLTGDVFGAIIETGTVTVLIVLALATP